MYLQVLSSLSPRARLKLIAGEWIVAGVTFLIILIALSSVAHHLFSLFPLLFQTPISKVTP